MADAQFTSWTRLPPLALRPGQRLRQVEVAAARVILVTRETVRQRSGTYALRRWTLHTHWPGAGDLTVHALPDDLQRVLVRIGNTFRIDDVPR